MNEIIRILELSDLFGPSGKEDEVSAYVCEDVKEICDTQSDSLRNTYLRLKGPQNRPVTILLDAHADEVGFIIQAVKPDGTLAFLPLGGQDAKNSCAQKVIILNDNGEFINGIVTAKPVHFESPEERRKPVEFSDLSIDAGAVSPEEITESFHIGPGNFAVPDVKSSYDEKREVFEGKAFDDRVGVACVLQCLHELSEYSDVRHNILGLISAQEEVGERGAAAAMRKIQADLCICFEGCPADDTCMPEYMVQSAMKKGPMLRHFDVSMITNPGFQKFALKTAAENGIPVQRSVRKGGGTNGGVFHQYDIPTIVIGVPVRYAHSAHGYMAFEDYKNAVRLALEIIGRIREEDIREF